MFEWKCSPPGAADLPQPCQHSHGEPCDLCQSNTFSFYSKPLNAIHSGDEEGCRKVTAEHCDASKKTKCYNRCHLVQGASVGTEINDIYFVHYSTAV